MGDRKISNRCKPYLTKHAEPEAALAQDFPWQNLPRKFPPGKFSSRHHGVDHVLVIPAYREAPAFLSRLHILCADNNALIILVINQPDTVDQCPENHRLWSYATGLGALIHQQGHLLLLDWDGVPLLVVDRFRNKLALPAKQGVGLARKIGCDIAAGLIDKKIINSPWINNTDADTLLPPDYFHRLHGIDGSAVVYPFKHFGDETECSAITNATLTETTLTEATLRYEQSLHYYVDGLTWAGSPYAFHTIGSCLAVHSVHYCSVRGFPKRAGGEDFYLLNKLVKLAPVRPLPGEPIKIQARHSDRVPFGTGPAVKKMTTLKKPDEHHTYDPQVFVELKILLESLSNYWIFRNRSESCLHNLSQESREVCQTMKFDRLFSHLSRQANSRESALLHIHHWFDGFRTLKFIHLLQSTYYPAQPLHRVLLQAKNLLSREN